VTDGRSGRIGRLSSALVVAALAAGCVAPSGTPTPTASGSTAPSPSPVASPSMGASPSPSTGRSPSPSAVPSTSPSTPATGLPDFPSIWVIVLENQDFGRVVDGKDMPFLDQLIDGSGLATRYTAVARPSQPNYFAMLSGSTQGVHDNDDHDIDAPTLYDQIEASGRTWREYAENRPSNCFDGALADGGRDGPGVYRRKHAPAISFDGIRGDRTRCANLLDFTSFEPGDADFSLIIPNQCHAAHDCKVPAADAWLAGFVPRILDSAEFKAGGLLVITFDEDAGNDPSGGHIATVLASPDVLSGYRSTVPYDHYSLLRTIEEAWSLDCLGEACAARAMTDFFDGA
jgi:phosphatidylinositol-3-phosphatase